MVGSVTPLSEQLECIPSLVDSSDVSQCLPDDDCLRDKDKSSSLGSVVISETGLRQSNDTAQITAVSLTSDRTSENKDAEQHMTSGEGLEHAFSSATSADVSSTLLSSQCMNLPGKFSSSESTSKNVPAGPDPPTGVMLTCGTRREMEDAVTVAHRLFHLPCQQVGGCLGTCAGEEEMKSPFHFFGVYDGHGGSQVSNFCKDRLHLTLLDEIEASFNTQGAQSAGIVREKIWERVMFATFLRIDAELEGLSWRCNSDGGGVTERISEPIAPETVGSTAVVAIVGSCQIVIANCGDSRAVLSRGGQTIALSIDHKPDRPDELNRIEAAGGRVICWNGYRVFGVLAMSRAIGTRFLTFFTLSLLMYGKLLKSRFSLAYDGVKGDRYLKPYVIAEPEVTCMSRSKDDDCLILATDGLWDVLTNDEVCKVARKCLAKNSNSNNATAPAAATVGSNAEHAKAAAVVLTEMALAHGSNDNISVVVIDLKDRKRH